MENQWRKMQFRRLAESMDRLQSFEAQGGRGEKEVEKELLFMQQILSTLINAK